MSGDARGTEGAPGGGEPPAQRQVQATDGTQGRYVQLPNGKHVFIADPPVKAGGQAGGAPWPATNGNGNGARPPVTSAGNTIHSPAARGNGRAKGGQPPAAGPADGAVPAPTSAPAGVPAMAAPPFPVGGGRLQGLLADLPGADPEENRKTPELRSEGLQEIIEIVPGRLARWGISVIAGAVLVLVVLAAVVRFPVIVAGTVSVTTPVAPVRVAAPAGGEIQHLLVRDGQTAAAGDVLAVLRSPAAYRALLQLKTSLSAAGPGELPAPAAPADQATLGEVLEPLARYEAARTQHAALERDAMFPARLASLRTQIQRQHALFDATTGRMRLLHSEVELAERAVARAEVLVERGLLSRAEAEQSETVLLGKQQAVENGRSEALSHQMRLAELEGQLLDVEQGRVEELRRLRLEGDKALSAVHEAVARWESRYLLRAPAGGQVSFFRRLGEGQYVAPGEPLIAVVPSTGIPVASVRIADEGVGGVRSGQRVVFRFSAYPYQEYGTVEGVVQSLSLVASEPDAKQETRPEYLVAVRLPQGLRSSHGKNLALRQEMSGTAEIVTENRSLLQRLLSRLTGGMDRAP